MTDFEKVIDFDNMYKAFLDAKSGKGNKKSSARFSAMALEAINTLIAELKDKTYRLSEYQEFKVYEPKERLIQSARIRAALFGSSRDLHDAYSDRRGDSGGRSFCVFDTQNARKMVFGGKSAL